MKRNEPGYFEALTDELAGLDCHTEEGKHFRDIALRLVELHQHGREITASAVLAVVNSNRVINVVADKLVPIIQAMDDAGNEIRHGEVKQVLYDEKHEALSLLRYIRKQF